MSPAPEKPQLWYVEVDIEIHEPDKDAWLPTAIRLPTVPGVDRFEALHKVLTSLADISDAGADLRVLRTQIQPSTSGEPE